MGGLVKLSKLMWLQLLLGDLKHRLDVLLKNVSEGAHKDELVLPELDQAPQHVEDVEVLHLGTEFADQKQWLRLWGETTLQ